MSRKMINLETCIVGYCQRWVDTGYGKLGEWSGKIMKL